MFNSKYSAEKSIKRWARAFYITALALPVVSLITMLVLFSVDDEAGLIGLIVFGNITQKYKKGHHHGFPFYISLFAESYIGIAHIFRIRLKQRDE